MKIRKKYKKKTLNVEFVTIKDSINIKHSLAFILDTI
jgi:hypothetical protein